MEDLLQKHLGQYKLTEIIRRGGMSTVYKAYQPSLDRYVAVKVLLYNRDPQFAARFKREARAIAQMQHPNILPIYDFGEQDGLLYLVLQYIENGLTLGDLLGQSMAPTQALRLTMHLLGALDYAHKRGVIHRDIKPANVLMPSMTWPMLADFGIAKLMNDSQQNLTSPGLIVGTAAYMAPEQATSSAIDARTDIYATGVVLFEMVTGRVPFDADTPMAMLTKHAYEAPPPPRLLKPDLSPLVEAVLLRALAKDPNARYQSAAAMAEELERVVTLLEQPKAHGQLTSLYQTGLHAFEEGRWDQAVEQLGQLVTLNPHFQDADDLLEAAREAQERAKTEARQIAASAQARGLIRKGREKQQAGNLQGALSDYQAARTAAPPGTLYQELVTLIDDVSARIEQAKRPAPASRFHCPQCNREVQPEWSGCPYCRAPLGQVLAETQPGAALPARPKPATQPNVLHAPTEIAPNPTVPELTSISTPAAASKLPRIGRRWQIWGAIAIALALMSLGGRAILANRSQNTNAPTPPAPTARGSTAAVVAVATGTPTSTTAPSPKPADTATPTTAPTSAPTDTTAPTAVPTATPEPPTAPPAPPTAPPEPQAVVNIQSLKLRNGPGEAFAVIGTYAQGTTFKIIGKEATGAWLNVAAPDNKVGWMSAEFLSLNVDAATLAVVQAPAAPAPTARPTARPTTRPATPRPQPTAPPQPQPTTAPPPPPPEPPTPEPPTPEPPPPTEEPPEEPDPTKEPKPPPTDEPPPPTDEPKPPTKTPKP